MKSKQSYIAVLAAVCACAVVAMSLLFPGARLSFLLPAAVVSGFIIAVIYEKSGFATSSGLAVVLAGYTLVVCGIVLNIHYFSTISGGSFDSPVLMNFDSRSDWLRAISILDGTEPPEGIMGKRYLNYIAAALMSVFGRDIGVPLMFNALCYSLTIILIGAVTYGLTQKRSTATAGICVGTLMCYFMVQATVFIKDVPLTMCFAALTLVMVRWSESRVACLADWAMALAALAGIAFLRSNALLFVIVGVGIFCIGLKRVDSRFVLMAAFCVAFWCLIHSFLDSVPVEHNVGVDPHSGVFHHGGRTVAWDNLMGGQYELMPVWKRLLWLPGSIIVQFLIPFPWNFSRDIIFGPTEALAHFGYFWYLAGGVLIYWLVAVRRDSPKAMRMIVWWGIIMTVLTAYMTSGRVSRYCLVYLPTLLPAVAYTLVECRHKKSLWVWMGVFALAMACVLITCRYLQGDNLA